MPRAEESAPPGWRWTGPTLSAVALLARLLFWRATPDAAWAGSAYYQGDAGTWLDYALALRAGHPFELGLPLRPPGNAYLVAALWNGEPARILWLKAAWCLLGALVVWLTWMAARRSFGPAVGGLAGLLCAGASGLLVLSTSLNNETPYLVLVLAGFCLWPELRRRPRPGQILAWSALNALACLVRVEHALFVVAAWGWLVWDWSRGAGGSWRVSLRRTALAAGACALVLAPWQWSAAAAVARFNRQPQPLEPALEAAYRRLEGSLAHLTWDAEARARRDALPVFSRRTLADFVAATVRHRGGARVRGDDFGILEEAFGVAPEPLRRGFFLVLYGGLNFSLANHAAADGGFSRAPLEAPPPLAGGRERYPPELVAGLPPADLSLLYPPHVAAINHGFAQGWAWIARQPGRFAVLATRKLALFWRGAALGLTGYDAPLGWQGTRRRVDLAVPEGGALAAAWRLALLAAAAAGAVVARPRAALAPWLLLAATKLAVAVAFFGYARQGAAAFPVLAVLLALGLARLVRDEKRLRRLTLAGCVLLLAVEATRFAAPPALVLGGQAVAADSFPRDPHRALSFSVR